MSLPGTICVLGVLFSVISATAQTRRDVPSSYPTIQSAIVAAVAGDEVVVAPGIYIENLDFLGKDIIVRSSAGPAATTIDGGQAGPVVRFRNAETSAAVLSGFSITNGLGATIAPIPGLPTVSEAGGIDIRGNASPRIISCVITGNTGGAGRNAVGNQTPTAAIVGSGGPGGVLASGLTLLIDCDIVANQGGSGGGSVASSGSIAGAGGPGGVTVRDAAKIHRSRIVANTGGPGGAAAPGGVLGITRGGPGGIDIFTTNPYSNSPYFFPDLDRCRVSGNFGGTFGGVGGIRMQGDARFGQCAIVDNTSGPPDPAQPGYVTGAGGADFFGSFRFEYGTIAGNTTLVGSSNATNPAAAGIVANGFLPVDIVGSIIWGNSALTGAGVDFAPLVSYPPTAANLIGCNVGSTNFSVMPPANISVNPGFSNPAGGDYRLTAASPCIDAVVPNPVAVENPPKDIDGNPRWLGAWPDIDAHEFGVYDASLLGTDDDIALASRIVGQGSPFDTSKACPVGARLGFAAFSPRRSYWFHRPIFVVDLFPSALPPIQNTIFPEFHWGPNRFVILDGNQSGATFGSMPYFDVVVPTTLSGFTARIQVITFEPTTSNGFFAATDAHDIAFL